MRVITLSARALCQPLVLGRYTVQQRLEAGRTATVHFAQLRGAQGFRRTVAAKIFCPQLAADGEFARRLHEEARRAARVRHRHVVATLELVEANDTLALMMEYVHGVSLGAISRSLCERGQALPPAVALAIAIGALHGLHALHEAQDAEGAPLALVHGDVSPDCILVGSDGIARIADTAPARALRAASALAALTEPPDVVLGERRYAAPEQHAGFPLGRAADVFAVGTLLSELLRGEWPDEGSGLRDRVRARLVAPLPAREQRPSAALDAVIARALAPDPAARYPTAREMALALAQCCPPARTAEVAAWVERAAGATLVGRAAVLEALERRDEPSEAPSDEPEVASSPGASEPEGEPCSELAGAPRVEASRLPIARGPLLSIAAALALGAAFGLWFGWSPPRAQEHRTAAPLPAPPMAAQQASHPDG